MLKLSKFKKADSRQVEKYWKYHSSPSNGPLGRNLAGRIPSRSRRVRRNAVAMATAVARQQPAHWTCSSGRLEAERVNQF